VRKALSSLPWVRQVQVDFDRKRVTITADAGKYDEKAIIKALEKEGFKSEVAKESRKS